MSQSHGIVPLANSADWLLKEAMDALDRANALQEDLIRGTTTEPGSYHYDPVDDHRGGDRDEGYYSFKRCRKKSFRGQILDKNNDTRLQQIVSEVADRYIKRTA